jgi:hypothetical protein
MTGVSMTVVTTAQVYVDIQSDLLERPSSSGFRSTLTIVKLSVSAQKKDRCRYGGHEAELECDL